VTLKNWSRSSNVGIMVRGFILYVIDNWDFIPLLPLLKCDESEILAIL